MGEGQEGANRPGLILHVSVWPGRGKAVGKRREIGGCLEVRKEQRKEREKRSKDRNFIAFGHQKSHMQMRCKSNTNEHSLLPLPPLFLH